MSLKELSFVLKSEKRKKLILLLKTNKTPTQLAKLMKSSLPNISLKLSGLKKKGLIKCFTPHERKGRIYGLTDKGKKVIKEIEKMEK